MSESAKKRSHLSGENGAETVQKCETVQWKPSCFFSFISVSFAAFFLFYLPLFSKFSCSYSVMSMRQGERGNLSEKSYGV